MILTRENIESIDLYGKIDSHIRNGESSKVLLVVPTNRKLRDLKKQVINLSPGSTVSQINMETLNTLSTKLLEQLQPFTTLSEAAASVFIKSGWQESDLKYFANYGDYIPAGILDRIKNVISEYKKHGITPEILMAESEKLEKSEKLKAIDIAGIYRRFKIKTDSINALDTGDVYQALIKSDLKNISNVLINTYDKVEFICFLGFDEFTKPEVEIISLIEKEMNAQLFIDFDYFDYNPLIFSHLDETRKLLINFGYNEIKDNSVYELPDFTESIRENLFLKKKKTVSKYAEKITQINAADRDEEIEIIAMSIKELIVSKNVEPHKICVVFNLISEFSSQIRDAFEKVGVPFNLTDRIPLDQSPPVIALINFLEILESDFYYKNIFRAVNGKYFRDFEIDSANLNFIASELKIVSGYNNWINSIENELKKDKSDDDKLDAESLRDALDDLKRIREKLEPFSRRMSPKRFFNNLLGLLTEAKISGKLLEGSPEYREENIVGLTEFIETLEEILNLIELQSDKENERELSFYLEQIKTAAGWARFNVKSRSDYGVLVTSVNEIRGLKFDYLFIAGLNEGIFPTRYNPEIFFSGSFAKKEITHQTEERYHFYQALTTWRKHLYLSSSQTADEREIVQSNFLNDFTEIFEHQSIDVSSFSGIAYNIEDVHISSARLFKNSISPEFAGIIEDAELEKLHEKIRINNLRAESPFDRNPFNGFLNLSENSMLAETLSKFTDREYSITQLETYARCPFKYFVQYVLKLRQTSEPVEEVEAIEIGSVLHKILYEFYTKVRERNFRISNCSEEIFNELLELIFSIAEANLSSQIFASEVSFYERERIVGIGGDRKQSILYQLLANERNSDESIEPSYFETAFGNIFSNVKDEKLSSLEPVKGGEVKFKGKIDRIDIEKESGTFDVVDYKLSLSSRPTLKDISDGISLQLPLYLFAAKKLFEKNEIDLTPGEVYLYSLKYSAKDFGKTNISLVSKKVENREEELELLFEETLKKIENYVENIVKGEFPLTSLEDREKKICRYCDFSKICRVDDTDL